MCHIGHADRSMQYCICIQTATAAHAGLARYCSNNLIHTEMTIKTNCYMTAAASVIALCSTICAAQEKIMLTYNDRPPYQSIGTDGNVEGLVADPVSRAFKTANIQATWVKIPTNRQLAYIKENRQVTCSPGWFKKPDREQFAKFTKALYRDKPAVVLANSKFYLREGVSLENLLASRGIRVLVKENYSYGPFIDGLLNSAKPSLIKTSAENTQMARILSDGNADIMFAAAEEAEYLVTQAGLNMKNFRLLKFPDMPNGEKRYLMCSKQVPDEWINRLNKGITFE
jgi:polar amino acid transport system substrate-binding protein